MVKRKICVVTGSRADYGLLCGLLSEIKADAKLKLQLAVTGMHLSKDHGLTYKRIEKDGFAINAKVVTLQFDDSENGITKAIGLGTQRFADAFKKLKPDVVVVLGDRYEILSAAVAAYIAKIPLAHIHGGEITQGLIDEGIRHSITKMANVHFATTNIYRKRIIQMGEYPKTVFNFGAPGLDQMYRMKFLTKKELADQLKFELDGNTAVVTYHPVTLEKQSPIVQVEALLKSIEKFALKTIFTLSNADTRGSKINKMIEVFCKKNPMQYRLVANLGQFLYYNCLKHFDVMIGNSSSGIIEAPSFKMPVVNIGDRQKARLKPKNVIDANYSQKDITRGIKKAISKQFRSSLKNIRNPYDRYRDGGSSRRIKEVLKTIELDEGLIKKKFYNL